MTHVFHRELSGSLPTVSHGDGAWIVDTEGRRYLDASGGAAVSCLGHSDPDVRRAILDQVERIPYAHTGFFTSRPAEELADLLVAGAPAGLGHVYYTSGGSEAVETAVKIARQSFVERGQPDRFRIVARRQSYHGATLGTMAVGDNPWRRAPFEPMLMEVAHVSPCNAYRDMGFGESPDEYGERLAAELEETVQALGPDTVAAFIAETVGGATLGAMPAVPGYFTKIRRVCDRHGILLILDEVMCGMGRTGTLFACEQDGVIPDMVCVAKGLAGGYQPLGAVLVSDNLYRAFRDGSGTFRHGHTYQGHPTACAAGLAVQRAIRDRGLLARVVEQGARLDEGLRRRLGGHPNLGDIRGRGLFRAVELVADRATRAPFDPRLKIHGRIKRQAMMRGLMCYPNGGSADGTRGDHVLLAPPYIVSAAEVDEIVSRLGDAIEAAIAETRVTEVAA